MAAKTVPSKRDVRRLRQMDRWQKNFVVRGPDVTVSNMLDHIEIHVARPPDRRLPPKRLAWIQVTGNSQDGSNFRWKYAWSQVAKTSAGFGGWATVSNGLSGTTSTFTAYNVLEDMNGASGLFGNGVNSSNLTGSFAVQPVPNGAILRAWIESPQGTNEMHFEYANGIDGAC